MTDIVDIVPKLRGMIEGLGTTSAEIAASLELEGVQGDKGSASSCAISAYVRKHFPEILPNTGYIGSVSITQVGTGSDEWDDYYAEVLANDVVCEDLGFGGIMGPRAKFIREFDEGLYPNLVKPQTIV